MLTVQSLVESIVIKLSNVLKFILSNVFEIDCIKINENQLVNNILSPNDILRLFSNKLYFTSSDLNSILKDSIEIKEKGSFFHFFKTIYPFQKEKAFDLLKTLAFSRGNIFLFESLIILIPDYLEKSNKTFNSLMFDEGYLPLTWRFYIAIMV